MGSKFSSSEKDTSISTGVGGTIYTLDRCCIKAARTNRPNRSRVITRCPHEEDEAIIDGCRPTKERFRGVVDALETTDRNVPRIAGRLDTTEGDDMSDGVVAGGRDRRIGFGTAGSSEPEH